MPSDIRKRSLGNVVLSSAVLFIGMFAAFVTMLSVVILLGANNEPRYSLLFLLPVSFLLCGTFLVASYLKSQSWISLILLAVLGIRLVVAPLVLCFDPYCSLGVYSPGAKEMNEAVLFICYESVFISLFMYVYLRISARSRTGVRRRVPSTHIEDLEKGNILFKLFVLIALFLFLFVPEASKGLSFFVLSSGSEERATAEADTLTNVLRQLVLIGQQIAFVLTATWAKRRYDQTGYYRYISIALLFALFCVGVIVGDRRASQIYTAFAALVLLTWLFPKQKKAITIVIVVVASFALLMLTIYKTFYAFNYDSYFEAITSGNQVFGGLGGNFDLYALGPTSVATGFAAGEATSNFNIGSLLFEIARCTIGISFLVKDVPIDMPTVIYNLFVSGGTRTSGYFIPIGVEGAVCTTTILGPLLPLAFLMIAVKIERLIRSSKSSYWVFFLSYVYIRFATCLVAGNMATILNTTTTVLITTGVLYVMSRCLQNGKSKQAVTNSYFKEINAQYPDVSISPQVAERGMFGNV